MTLIALMSEEVLYKPYQLLDGLVKYCPTVTRERVVLQMEFEAYFLAHYKINNK